MACCYTTDPYHDMVGRHRSACSEFDAEDIERTEFMLRQWSHHLLAATVHTGAGACVKPDFKELSSPAVKPSRSCDSLFSLALFGAPAGPQQKQGLAARGIHSRPCVQGAVVLRGNMEEQPATLQFALERALLEVLQPVAGCDTTACISPCQRTSSNGLLLIDDKEGQRFDFEANVADDTSASAARDVLKQEAAAAGALKLLPALACSLAEVGRLSVRIEMDG